jgi:hypothetical protein
MIAQTVWRDGSIWYEAVFLRPIVSFLPRLP